MPRKRSQSRATSGRLGRTPGLDAPVLSRLDQGRSQGRPGNSALRLLESLNAGAPSDEEAGQQMQGEAPRAPASPTTSAAAASAAFADPMDRLMADREARLSGLRNKLHL